MSQSSSIGLLFGVLGLALLGSVFFSPAMALAAVGGIGLSILTFKRPTWSLALLLWYLPFEPFILKWVPDDIYVYARYSSELLIYLLCAVTAWKIVSGRINWRPTPADLPFVLFLVVLCASALINFEGSTIAVLGIRQILRFMLLFYVTVYLAPSEQWIKGLFYGLLAIMAIEVAIGYGQALVGEPADVFLLPSETRTLGTLQLTSGTQQFWEPGTRIFATMGRYDQLGTWLALIMIIIVSVLYEPKLKAYHSPLAGLLIASLPALALTASRSSWFGFALGTLFVAVAIKRDKRVVLGGVGLMMAIGLYLGVTGLVVNRLVEQQGQGQGTIERFLEAFSYERWRSEYYGLGRLYWIVQTTTQVVPAAPIFGHGPGTYGGGAAVALNNTHVYDDLSLPFGVYGTDGYVDNNWMSLWGESGTLGMFMYLWLYLGLFVVCYQVYRRSKVPETRALALGVAGIMLSVALNAFLATFLEVRTLAPYLWVLCGLVVVSYEREHLAAKT